MLAVSPPCRCCGNPKVTRPRGLCWSCYYRPGVKEQFASTSVYARRGTVISEFMRPPSPTMAEPGSAAKVDTLAARLEAGEYLWHSDDATDRTQARRSPARLGVHRRRLLEFAN